jgi:hypothetical protein
VPPSLYAGKKTEMLGGLVVWALAGSPGTREAGSRISEVFNLLHLPLFQKNLLPDTS